MFGASREIVAATAIQAQPTAKKVTQTVDETRAIGVIGRTRYSGSPDHIVQIRLPLSFRLTDTPLDTRCHVLSILPDERAI